MSTTTSDTRTMSEKAKAVGGRVLVFLIFAVAIALLPIVGDYLEAGRKDATEANFDEVIGGGELLIVSVGIVVAAAAELFAGASKTELQTDRGKQVILGLLFVIAVLASIEYSGIGSSSIDNRLNKQAEAQVVRDLEKANGQDRSEAEALLEAKTKVELPKQVIKSKVGVASKLQETTVTTIERSMAQSNGRVRKESMIFLGSAIFLGVLSIVITEL